MFEPTLHQYDSQDWDRLGPSSHLSWDELACHDEHSTPYPRDTPEGRVEASCLSIEFEWVRHLCGDVPIEIGSAYRTLAWNREIGSTSSSQHVKGRALDIYPPKGHTVATLLRIVRARSQMSGSKLRGIGEYRWGVHFDTRPQTRLARWRGGRVRAEVA